MALRLLVLRAGRLLLPVSFLVLFSVRGWVDPKAIVGLEVLGKLTKSNTYMPQPATLPRDTRSHIKKLLDPILRKLQKYRFQGHFLNKTLFLEKDDSWQKRDMLVDPFTGIIIQNQHHEYFTLIFIYINFESVNWLAYK